MNKLQELRERIEKAGVSEDIQSESRINIAKTPLEEARRFAKSKFEEAGKNFERSLPNFNENYKLIRNKIDRFSLDIPRDEMPVIEPGEGDLKEFENDLQEGHIDLFKPFAWNKEFAKQFPEAFASEDEREEFLTLGLKDGENTDDVLKADVVKNPVGDLLPLQSQIWLGRVIPDMLKFGLPEPGSPVLTQTIIRSREGYILDGHHRWSQTTLKNPDLEMSVLKVPLDIDTLLEIGKSFSRAIGREPKK